MSVDYSVLAALGVSALFAGFVDSVVGGGGLIQVPALFTLLPREIPATLFGTNKFASIVGTANAAWRYASRVNMPWRTTLWASFAALVFSYLGAAAVAWLPRELLRPLILFLLIGSALYTYGRKDFGCVHDPRHSGRREVLYALALGGGIGFYDGFFGPGAGSFMIFLFIRGFGFDFLHASAASKVVNATTNFAALAYFMPNGFILPVAAVVMALCNVGGSMLGTHLALRHGSGFVRKVFLLVVSALIVKFAWDTLRA